MDAYFNWHTPSKYLQIFATFTDIKIFKAFEQIKFHETSSIYISFNILIRIKSLDPLRAKNIFIRKTEDGPYQGFSYKSLISDP